jgi:tetratricopeptide (TPR) repeat protein
MRRSRLVPALLLGLAALPLSPPKAASTAAPPASAPLSSPAGTEALDYAFRFASAIRTDPKDMGRAQGQVLLDYASVGATDEALKKTGEVVGWNRGVVYAELAAELAKAGRKNEARGLVAKAESVRAQTQGWQGPRIASHISRALALLGDTEASQGMASRLQEADDRYAGLSLTAQATSHAAKGSFDEAMRVLGSVPSSEEVASAPWRAEGYLEIARQTSLEPEQRIKALDAASTALALVPGWTKAGLLQQTAGLYRELGDLKKATAALETAESSVTPLPATAALKGPMVASLARHWHEAGRSAHARALLVKAEEEAPKTLAIDRPIVYGSIAAAYVSIGDEAGASRVYERALDAAASLENSRPRALAIVEICRSMGLSKRTLDPATRTRLDRLFQGLGDPW